MPYITEIPSSLITVGIDGVVAFVPNTSLLNAFDASQEFAQYDVDAPNGPVTLANGDNMTPVDATGAPLTAPGTYVGSVTVNNAAASVGIPGLAAITLQVNPISGHMMEAGGSYYFVSDTALDDDHLNVTASITVGGIPVSVTGPISGIAAQLAAAVQPIPIAGPLAAGLINGSANLIQTTANTAVVTMNHDTAGTLPLPDEDVFCFVAGTLIETENGFVAVETLKAGDLVVTRDNGLQPVRWVGSVTLSAASLKAQPKLLPIRVKAGALGANTPTTDLLVSPQHRILIRSKVALKMFGTAEILVAAKQLLQIEGVDIATDMESVEYVHFLFDQHEVVNSNGAATESLYTGAQALKSVGKAAREEIFALFPQLQDADFTPAPARPMPSGRKSRKLANRHAQHHRAMVC